MPRQKKKKKVSAPLPELTDDYDENFIPSCILEDDLDDTHQKSNNEQISQEQQLQQARERRKNKKIQKREKKLAQELAEEKAITKAKLAEPLSLRNKETDVILKKWLSPNQLSIMEVSADGNCLYSAISSQLSLRRKMSVARSELRKRAADYMRGSADEFLQFLDTDLDPHEFLLTLCDKIEQTSEWGGEIELRALSHSLQVPITIYSAENPIQFGEQFEKPALLLSYHKHYYSMGAHYNSVVDLLE